MQTPQMPGVPGMGGPMQGGASLGAPGMPSMGVNMASMGMNNMQMNMSGMGVGAPMGMVPQGAQSMQMQGGMEAPSQQQQQCLRYPDSLGAHTDMSPEKAADMLLRASVLATEKPFVWGYIDRPTDNSLYLVFFPRENSPPNDGLRYLEKENKYVSPAGGDRQLEIAETRFGFIPGSGEPTASRVRRRFRLVKGGSSKLVLIWYTRGQAAPINPSLHTQPVRPYPLPPISQPPVWVGGERAGQRYYGNATPGATAGGMGQPSMSGTMGGMPPGVMGGMPPGGMAPMGGTFPPGIGAMPAGIIPAGMSDQAALLARQALEHRRVAAVPPGPPGTQVAPHGAPHAQAQQHQGPLEDEEERDVSTRSVAAARFTRNHEWMNEVFAYAAFGDKALGLKPKRIAEIFVKDELDAQVQQLQQELEELNAKGEARRAAAAETKSHQRNISDASMGALSADGTRS